ncbi:LytTR family DNA-binding domain-containing protein [Ruminococcus sp. OA3]|uniref:LytR/AlgR family response regulator transcription factor n=1 Tax=Ruminococcus sp. OA3 TaxID=2914164 RepID=UPI001F0543EF|nr:LytTR family DNA-binding domain-containing protein [Ruminococcus sp. OA3]MCH1984508.1 LytTR family DNA-binding domain-containing protein [Ruminococcus sp. OA3]
MIRVAITDDNELFLKIVESIVKTCLRERKVVYEIKTYAASGNLLWDLEEHAYFDILLIDIEMPGVNGLELARQIRLRYLQPYLVFITSHVEYSVEGYEYNAYRYVLKDCVEDKLPLVLEKIVGELEKKVQRQYIIELYSKVQKIDYEEIYYLHVEGKYTYFHTGNEVFRERITLNKAYQKLNADEFVYIDKSNVVNLHHVMELKDRLVVMRGGEKLPVSIPQYRGIKQAISSYWSRS